MAGLIHRVVLRELIELLPDQLYISLSYIAVNSAVGPLGLRKAFQLSRCEKIR
jgi:hypothetical protein